ncbi:MAG: glutamine--fructose-6-phosphate transaminase (isomerizing) [Pseudomonadota bacterium]|nr:glutamine--fructose-6-phosphate transaminase (isomerizing) [Pseudomonadota bacterium]
MCGIIGIVSKNQVVDRLIKGLQCLEYRGYDSSGVAAVNNEDILFIKSPGKLVSLKNKLKRNPIDGFVGIGHTRWATHGEPTETNAHPHVTKDVAVVHNGIIENFAELKNELLEKGVIFKSQTDTEIIAQLVEEKISKEKCQPLEAVRLTIERLSGSFALCFIFRGLGNLLICARRGSPLALGFGVNENFVSSDATSLSLFSQKVCYLEEGDVAVLTQDDVSIFDSSGKSVDREVQILNRDPVNLSKGKYKHFMEKEIFEQPQVISQVLGFYLNASEETLSLPTLPEVTEFKRIVLIGCGTAFYSCLVAKYWFEKLCGLPTHAELASEFRYRSPVVNKDDLLIFVSQSGETADTIGALRFTKNYSKNILAIVNVEESSIAREATWVFPTKAGSEIGVASTKAFVSQLIILKILNIKFASDLSVISNEQKSNLLKGLLELPRLYAEILSKDQNIKKLCKKFIRSNSVLYLGRDILYPIALEGALKLKEISYLHAEGYASGELKHGPIALVDKSMPVVALNPSTKVFEKTLSNLEEVKARRGKIILFTDEKGEKLSKDLTKSIFQLPNCSDFLAPILYSLPLQLIAYYTALEKGTDVDQPRNLAKSVTVE